VVDCDPVTTRLSGGRNSTWLDVSPPEMEEDMPKKLRCKANLGRHVPFEVQGLLDLVLHIYQDACTECAVNPDPRDIETICQRTEDEGLSFLTITLPTFSRDFERSLADRRIDSKSFLAFRKFRAIPAFLQGMLNLIFDGRTGEMYDSPRIPPDSVYSVVAAVRQVCRCFNKLQARCSPEREQAALRGFSEIEQSLAEFKIQEDDIRDFNRVCRLIWDPLFSGFNPNELIPKHGPGVTSEGIRGNSKYLWKLWHDRLEEYFPFLGFSLPLGAANEEDFEKVSFVPPEAENPSRIISVPKTLKGPRIIAAEPLPAQYAQGSLQTYLYDAIERYWLTRRRINFRDQSINQRLALIGSRTGKWSTLDLSDASDRVYNTLAMSMFDGCPFLRDSIQACRTTRAKLPNGSLVGPLVKFASMGSALCFPVEAMYFFTICTVAMLRKRNLPFDIKSVHRVGRDIFVYGDDLVVPTDEAAAVCDSLLKYNSKVNLAKSFWTGMFRESCGLDAYGGRMVTPTYVRHFLPAHRRHHTEIISILAAANAFYLRGYWNTARSLFERIEKLLGSLPVVSRDSPALGRISLLPGVSVSRWNPDLMRFEVKAWVVEPIYRTDRLDGYGALAKSLLSLERLNSSDVSTTKPMWKMDLEERLQEAISRDPLHLERVARHGVATLKRRAVRAT